MERFGVIKNKVLAKLTESYASENKTEFKKTLNTVKANKDFADAYLFYEMVDEKYFDSKETAVMFVEQVESLLGEKSKGMMSACKSLSPVLGGVVCESNEVYEALDVLSEAKTFANIEAKVVARQKLVKHLTTPKAVVAESVDVKVDNQNLLNAVLVNNFNTKYAEQLNEEQKALFSEIMAMTESELGEKMVTLKESLISELDALIVESVHDDTLIKKLNAVVKDVEKAELTKHSYYRLRELKNNL
jgi:succinate dehydrogenase flavin-adding protein (antitoxin of CptAB toxin-antitoxin module)